MAGFTYGSGRDALQTMERLIQSEHGVIKASDVPNAEWFVTFINAAGRQQGFAWCVCLVLDDLVMHPRIYALFHRDTRLMEHLRASIRDERGPFDVEAVDEDLEES